MWLEEGPLIIGFPFLEEGNHHQVDSQTIFPKAKGERKAGKWVKPLLMIAAAKKLFTAFSVEYTDILLAIWSRLKGEERVLSDLLRSLVISQLSPANICCF